MTEALQYVVDYTMEILTYLDQMIAARDRTRKQ
jgi:hypothetical protein